ncbi:MAG TPA: phospho-N-acetylmuramoyl-pentapeptide-transferase [Elusimicrobiota bacterium]|nr:phospho-N-acetylmuramoyl-pentapeptide-transferase [Elusimicrobiota bacterium]
MLYYLSAYKNSFGALNLFQYITFRAGGAVLTSLLLSLLAGPWLIRTLKQYKIGQIQRTDGPSSHSVKQGTPTMGGLLIFVSVVLSTLLWMRPDVRWTWLLIFAACALSGVGAWDDYLKLSKKSAAGASSRVKFAVQISTALLVVFYLAVYPPNAQFLTQLNVPYGKELFLGIGSLYFFLATLMIVGFSNAVNLTDGQDGLVAGSIIFCAIAYGAFAYVAGNVKFADYLRIVHVEGAGEISVFLSAVIGSCLGFLWFNAYPAEIFMGDTGSLFLGGTIALVALCVKQEILLPIVGGVFVLETLSVILQMGSYKLRKGKRIFKMAPIHHHFELSGIAEPKVTVRFWIVSIILMLAALASLKIR